MKLHLLMLGLLLLAGCKWFEQPPATGVLEGKITIGPLCPVETVPPDPKCEPTLETYRAWPLAVTRNGIKITNIVANGDGTYRLDLAPGTYIVDFEKQMAFRKNALPATVTIAEGQVTTLDINIDTGIR
ncbi:MAG TPA: hypothetical protein VLJ21_02680 [Candidatus Binatia bacterium]|nr:hypothetical protein [Candidatus Binatia bacterium]